MLGSNNSNSAIPVLIDDNNLQFPANTSKQVQLFKNWCNVACYATEPGGCSVDPINHFETEDTSPMLQCIKRSRQAEDTSKQSKLQISLDHGIYCDEADHKASVLNHNPLSTGLRLSYDDDERNSSVTSASGSMTAASSIMLSLGENIRTELDRQREELDQYMKTQADNLARRVRDIKQRQMASFLSALEKGLSKKLHEKDVELERINCKNKELVERMKQVATDARSWCYRAKYNESVVNILKNNLDQALHGGGQGKEGFGDSEMDDAASCIDPSNYFSMPSGFGKPSLKDNVICKACNAKEVSILLMPCRHLCLCKDCEEFVDVCPACHLMKIASIQVYLS